jgi:TPR repeat protein
MRYLKSILKQVIYIFIMKIDLTLMLFAAIEGHSGAQLQLGIIYKYGTYGVSKDPIIGEFWLHNAAIQGHILANRYLSEIRCEYFDF